MRGGRPLQPKVLTKEQFFESPAAKDLICVLVVSCKSRYSTIHRPLERGTHWGGPVNPSGGCHESVTRRRPGLRVWNRLPEGEFGRGPPCCGFIWRSLWSRPRPRPSGHPPKLTPQAVRGKPTGLYKMNDEAGHFSRPTET